MQRGKDATEAPQAAADLQNLPVLIVDDNQTNRLILVENLQAWRFRPVAVDSGDAALAALHRAADAGEPFALVLLDAMMPNMNGFEVAAKMRHAGGSAGATIMMLSSAGGAIDRERCRELGIAEWLIKPVKQSDLLEAIQRAVGESSAKRHGAAKTGQFAAPGIRRTNHPQPAHPGGRG